MKTYRDILRREFMQRVAKNPRFSLRAFAAFLGISPSGLSLILNHKQGLGLTKAMLIVSRLGLGGAEKELFLKSISSDFDPDKEFDQQRALLEENIYDLSSDQDIVRDWYNLAILELTELHGLDLNLKDAPAIIAKLLDLNPLAVKMSLQKLVELKLLEIVEGQYVQTQKEAALPTSPTPNQSIRLFHEQILDKAKRSIYEGPMDQRNLGATILAMGEDDYAWACEEILKLRRKLLARAQENKPKTKLYCFSGQFFSLLNEKS